MHSKDVNYNICTQNSSCIAFNIRVVARVSEAPSFIQIKGSLMHFFQKKKMMKVIKVFEPYTKVPLYRNPVNISSDW